MVEEAFRHVPGRQPVHSVFPKELPRKSSHPLALSSLMTWEEIQRDFKTLGSSLVHHLSQVPLMCEHLDEGPISFLFQVLMLTTLVLLPALRADPGKPALGMPKPSLMYSKEETKCI